MTFLSQAISQCVHSFGRSARDAGIGDTSFIGGTIAEDTANDVLVLIPVMCLPEPGGSVAGVECKCFSFAFDDLRC